MNTHILKILTLLLPFCAWHSSEIQAVEFFKDNFDTNGGARPKSFPDVDAGNIWSLAPDFPSLYGPNNHFNLTDKTAHSAPYSLRITYEARNGICNTCGTKWKAEDKEDLTHLGPDGVDYFIEARGVDLSIADYTTTTKEDDGSKALPGRFVYNRSGGYSLWEIVSVENENATSDRLNLKLASEGINGENTINSSNVLAIARQCGVDGTIGIKKGVNDIVRRSDCNSVIQWFTYVGTDDQNPGESIFRRVYLKQETTNPNVRQKLHYMRPDRGGPNQGEVVTFGHRGLGNTEPQVSGFIRYGGQPIITSKTVPLDLAGFEFERSKWYYVEEEYHAANATAFDSSGNPIAFDNTGYYKLWFGESGAEPAQASPTLEVTDLSLPPISGGSGTHMSFWGNFQHETHARGHWYMDDVIVSDTFNGPVLISGANTSPPTTPTIQK